MQDEVADAARLATAFAVAQAALRQAKYWQDQADAAWAASWANLKKAVTWEVWKIPGCAGGGPGAAPMTWA